MSGLRLAVFDCDGTLVDSLHAIAHAMQVAFEQCALDPPGFDRVRQIVGLSVPEAVNALAPVEDPALLNRLDHAFRRAAVAHREEQGTASPLYPGAREALARLDEAQILLGVATGKARRGLDYDLDCHRLADRFIATQTADDAPSKPHPGMLENCSRLTGVDAASMAMIGDTVFDVEMARAFGCPAIGVSWGYHAPAALLAAGAVLVIDEFAALDGALEEVWGAP